MTDTRSYEDVSTDPPKAQGRPSDLVKDDLPDADGGEQSEQLHERHDASDFEVRTADKLAAADETEAVKDDAI